MPILPKNSRWLESYVLDVNNKKFPFCDFDCGFFNQFQEHIFDMIVNHNEYIIILD